MANFDKLNDNVTSVLMRLIESQDLCKLLSYSSSNPYEESDIEDTSSLINTKIFPFPKLPTATTEAGSFVNFFFDSFELGDTNSVKDGKIVFTVVVHLSHWSMGGRLKPISIMTEIDKLFNDQRVIGLKKLQFDRGKFIWVNENFAGYELIYRMVSENK